MPELKRSLGLGHAAAINMIDMVGIGPFITLPTPGLQVHFYQL
jgi:fructoselysine transporter